MRDRGKVTVFLCLIMSVLVVFCITCLKVVSFYCAEGKAAMVSRTSLSDVKANYNRYIFDQYHILLFDKTNYGEGEAAIEKRLEELTQENLGLDYKVNSVSITDIEHIYDNSCEDLKKQVKEEMKYLIAEDGTNYVIDQIKGETDYGKELHDTLEGVDSEDEIEGSEDNGASDTVGDVSDTAVEASDSADDVDTSDLKDPRKFTSTYGQEGVLLQLLLPEGEQVAIEQIPYDDLVSNGRTEIESSSGFDSDFKDYKKFKKNVDKYSSWNNDIGDKGITILYAKDVFNCFTNKSVNESAFLECELEYIICGKESDKRNLESICFKIIAMRLPLNMAYLLTDVEKMAIVESLASSIAAATLFVAEPVIKYLICGAWAYIESMVEVKNLLAGNKIEFVKTKDGWITDLDDIPSGFNKDVDNKAGLTYMDFLMLMMTVTNDDMYYRMLDVMDINARQSDSRFKMYNAAISIGVDFDIEYMGKEINIHQSTKYSP